MTDQLQRLKAAIESNNRIANAQEKIKTLEAEINLLDEHTKLLMMQTIDKQQKIDALKSELENAAPIDVDNLCMEILKVMEN